MIRVVLVDDDAMVRTGLRLILGGDPDLEIVGEAGDGHEALELLADVTADVVLLDIRMPRTDGLTVLDRLRDRVDAPAVVVLTTFDADAQVLRALSLGAKGFLLKDTDPPEMIRAIRAAGRGEPVLSPTVARTVIQAATRRAGSDPAAVARVGELSPREREVAVAIARGRTNAEIGAELFMSLATVKATVTRIFTKLEVEGRVQAAMLVRDAGLLDATGE